MSRRSTKNRTGLPRIEGIAAHDPWISYVCVSCSAGNTLKIDKILPEPVDLFEQANWECQKCGFQHNSKADLPFAHWPARLRRGGSLPAKRFWISFFRVASENPQAFWKQCNACGRVLPFFAFSRHSAWGPLERQMECRNCKGAINADLNPRRTAQQLHEGSVRRRTAELLMKGEHERIDIEALFKRFGGRCFKTGHPLDIKNRGSWAIDHILPSRYLYPLSTANAALLSKDANDNKRDRWPSAFYTNSELTTLADLTGADLSLLATATPLPNPHIDVDRCVSRMLTTRERSNLKKRVDELKKLLVELNLVPRLSPKNKKKLGFSKG